MYLFTLLINLYRRVSYLIYFKVLNKIIYINDNLKLINQVQVRLLCVFEKNCNLLTYQNKLKEVQQVKHALN